MNNILMGAIRYITLLTCFMSFPAHNSTIYLFDSDTEETLGTAVG